MAAFLGSAAGAFAEDVSLSAPEFFLPSSFFRGVAADSAGLCLAVSACFLALALARAAASAAFFGFASEDFWASSECFVSASAGLLSWLLSALVSPYSAAFRALDFARAAATAAFFVSAAGASADEPSL